jgi:DNA-binding CsgD family transcriptional regulator
MGALLGAAASSRSLSQLRGAILDRLGAAVGTDACGIYEFDDRLRPGEVHAVGVPDRLLHMYEETWVRSIDVIVASVAASNLPVHSLKQRTSDEWHREPLYQNLCGPFGFEHIMVAPLFGDGRIVGSLHMGRRKHERPFDGDDERRMMVVGGHVSALMARLSPARDVELASLTPREREIATLVAAGLNNVEIARCLSISRNTVKELLKRMFLKLGVDSRAELAATVGR